jgi:uncharacterized protein (DUF433 family)
VGDAVPLLDRPVYTYPQVDRLLALTKGTSQRWLNGYKSKRVFYPPVLRAEPSETRWVTWGEFVETRLFAGYRDLDEIPTRQMRRVVEVLRQEFHQKYPLAHSQPYLQPEGRLVLWRAQQEAGLVDEFAVEVATGQTVLTPWVTGFVESADFDQQADGAALALRPDPDFPAIAVDPRFRGGEPVISGRSVRVTTIAGLVRGGEPVDEVSDWYDLDEDQVRQAVAYDRLHARIA